MDDFMLVIDYFFTVLTEVYNLMISNWLFTFTFVLFIFSLTINVLLVIRGK